MRFVRLLIFFVALAVPVVSHGKTPTFLSLYAKAAYGIEKPNVILADPAFGLLQEMKGNSYHLAFGAEFFKKQKCTFGMEVGFAQQHLKFPELEKVSGLYLTRIPMELNFTFYCISVGIRTDRILNPTIIDTEDCKYAGLSTDCIRNWTLTPFVGLFIPAGPDVRLYAKFNIEAISIFDYEKISYYNMRHNKYVVDGLFEFGISVRLFTTGRRQTYWYE